MPAITMKGKAVMWRAAVSLVTACICLAPDLALGQVTSNESAKRADTGLETYRYAPDGKTLLGIEVRDADGRLLKEWSALTKILEVYFYDPLTLEQKDYPPLTTEKKINQNGKHESVTRSEMCRVTAADLGAEPPCHNPTSPRVTAKGKAPAGAPPSSLRCQKGLPDLRSVHSSTWSILGKTIYSPLAGLPKPLYHVDRVGSVDAVYDVKIYSDHTSVNVFRIHSESPTNKNDPWREEKWNPSPTRHAKLWNDARRSAVFAEARINDVRGRLTEQVLQSANERWVTCHYYDGNTLKLHHSVMTYARLGSSSPSLGPEYAETPPCPTADTLVADVYYPVPEKSEPSEEGPGYQTLDSVLKDGVDAASFARSLADTGATDKQKDRLCERFGSFLGMEVQSCEALSGPRPATSRAGFKELADHDSDLVKHLDDNGVGPDTAVESSVFVSRGGGISLVYRFPLDPLERVLMIDLGYSRTISSEWEGAETTKSVKLTPANDVLGTYETARDASQTGMPIMRQRVEKIFTPLYAWPYYNYAASYLGHAELQHIWWDWCVRVLRLIRNAFAPTSTMASAKRVLFDDFNRIGLKPSTVLTIITFTPNSFSVDNTGQLHFPRTPVPKTQAREVYGRLPDDPLGNYIVQSNDVDRKDSANRGRADVGAINLWWMRGDRTRFEEFATQDGREPSATSEVTQNTSPANHPCDLASARLPPIDVSPGTAGVQQSPIGQLKVFQGQMVFQGRDPSDETSCDPSFPALAQFTPTIQDLEDTLDQCCKFPSLPKGHELSEQAYQGIKRLKNTAVQGYWYKVTEGNYLERELHERNTGRIYLQQYAQVLSGILLSVNRVASYIISEVPCIRALPFIRAVADISKKKRIYFDTSVPYFKPLLATDERGEITAVWLSTEVCPTDLGKELTENLALDKTQMDCFPSGGEKQTLRVRDPVSGHWHTAIEETDVDGLPYFPRAEHSSKLWLRLIGCPVLLVAFLGIASFIGRFRWKKFVNSLLAFGDHRTHVGSYHPAHCNPQHLFGSCDERGLYDGASARLAVKRIAERVLTRDPKTNMGSPLWKAGRGRVFTANGIAECGFLFYIYPIYAAVISWRKRVLTRNTPRILSGLTEEEQGRVLSELLETDKNPDWLGQLDRFIVQMSKCLMTELSRQRGKEARFGGRTPAGEKEAADPDIWEKLTAYLQLIFLQLRESLDTGEAELTETAVEEETSKSTLAATYHKVCEAVRAAYCSLLKTLEPSDFPVLMATPEEVLTTHCITNGVFSLDGAEYKRFVEKSGWEALRHGRWDKLRRFIGWQTKSIHVYAGQEYADLLPQFALVLLCIGLIFSKDVKSVLDTLRHPRVITGIVGAFLITGIGGFAEWHHMSTAGFRVAQRLHCWMNWTLGAVCLLGVIGVSFIATQGNLGIWFLKVVLVVIALAEAWGYLAMGHSLIGLSFYYHCKPTIGVARPIVIALFIVHQLAFMAIGMLIATLTYSWWYGHYLQMSFASGITETTGLRVRLLGGFLVLNMTLYLIYAGIWFLVTGITSFAKTLSCWLMSTCVMTVARKIAVKLLTSLAPWIHRGLGASVGKGNGGPEVDSAVRPHGGQPTIGAEDNLLINYVGPPLASSVFKAFDEMPSCQSLEFRTKHASRSVAERYTKKLCDLLDSNFAPTYRHLLVLRACAKAHHVRLHGSEPSSFRSVWDWLTWLVPSLRRWRECRQLRDAFVTKDVASWLRLLHREELKNQVSLLSHSQLSDLSMDRDLQFREVSGNDRLKILMAWNIIRQAAITTGVGEAAVDTAIHIADVATCLSASPLKQRVLFVQTFNNHGNLGELNLHRADDSRKRRTALLERPAYKDFSTLAGTQYEKIGRLFSHLSGQREAHSVIYNWTNVESKSATMNGLLVLDHELTGLRAMHILDRNANCFQLYGLLEDYRRILENATLVVLTPLRNTTNTIEPIGRQSEAIEGGHGSTLVAVADKIGTGWENLMAVYFWPVVCAMSRFGYPVSPLSSMAYCVLRESKNIVKDFTYFGLIGFTPNAIGQSEDLWAVLQQTHNLIGLGCAPRFGVLSVPASKLRESDNPLGISAAATRWAGGLIDTLRSSINQQISFFGPESIFERKARRSVERFYLAAPIGVLSIVLIFPAIFFDMYPFVGILLAFWVFALLFNQVLSLHGLVASCRARGSVSGFSSWILKRINDVVLFAPRYFMEAAAVAKHLAGGDHSFARSPLGARGRGPRDPVALFRFVRNDKVMQWAKLPLALATIVIVETIYFTSVNLDFSNVVLLWLVLAFVGGAAVGFFTENSRPGKYQPIFDEFCTFGGILWGVSMILAPHYAMFGRYSLWITATLWAATLVGIFGLGFLHLAAKKIDLAAISRPILRRGLSNLERGAVKMIAIFGWFAVMQVPDSVRVTISESAPLVVSFEQILALFLLITGVCILIWLVGATSGLCRKFVLWRAFDRLARVHYCELLAPHTASGDSGRVTRCNALMTEFLVKMGLGHWADAKRSLDLMKAIMSTSCATSGTQLLWTLIHKLFLGLTTLRRRLSFV